MKRLSLAIPALFLVAACAAAEPPAPRSDGIPEWLQASVQLFAERGESGQRAGSGVVLATDETGMAVLVTAGHLLTGSDDERVYVHAPRSGAKVEAEVLVLDEERDLAILKAEGLEAAAATLKPRARLGDEVWVVSFPWGRRGTLVTGIVSQIADLDGAASMPIEGPVALIDAAVSYGTSGGGVFDGETGKLIGIVRGYRTAKLALPGPQPAALEFPIAGETTVVPTTEILCLLSNTELGDMAAVLGGSEAGESCLREKIERADAGF